MTTPAAAPAAPAAAAPAAPAASTDSLIPATPAAPAAPASDTSLLPAQPAAPAAPAAPATPADPNSPNAWVLAEGVLGQGERPAWFKADKYKSVADQAAAYTELEKRFGAFTGAPKEGKYDYALPEGVGVQLDTEHPLVGTFTKWAAENQLSQKGFTELLGMLGQYEAQHMVDMSTVKAELGDNADARITAVAQWGAANLDKEGYELLRRATSGPEAAAVFQVLESVIGKTKQVALPKAGADVPPIGPDAHKEIDKLMAEKLPNGKLRFFEDPKFRAEVEAKRAALYQQ